MGIIHFAGLGKSPGAVTAGLSYLKNEIGDHPDYRKIVEGVVIFTSQEIVSGDEEAYQSVDNEYMRKNVRKTWTKGLKNSLEIVRKFLHREFEGGDFYLCIVDVNDFDECFETIAKALLRFHPRGEVGKHIWANLTGGTNVLNAALMQVAYLSGLIPVMYYTFVANMRENGKYLNPFSRNEDEFYFRRIDMFKTTFDERFLYILEKLEEAGDFISSEEILSRLKKDYPNLFGEFDLTIFRRDYLNIMDGWCIERRKKEDLNRLSKNGKNLLKRIRSPLVTALIGWEYSEKVDELTKDLKIKKI